MLARTRPAQVTLTRYQSLDPIGHYYLRYAMPSEFGDVTDDERRRLGAVLERHYAIIDETVGRAMAAIGPDDLLLDRVRLRHGAARLREAVDRTGDRRPRRQRHARRGAGRVPHGVWRDGGERAPGSRRAPRFVDVTPTILYFLGLPIGRDMDGFAQTDLFQPSFTDERPITYIPTYDR